MIVIMTAGDADGHHHPFLALYIHSKVALGTVGDAKDATMILVLGIGDAGGATMMLIIVGSPTAPPAGRSTW